MAQRQPAAPASDLRSRIVERMPEILRLIRPNVEMGEGDVRPAIIDAIKQIERFSMEVPSVARDKHARVEKLAKHLRWAIRGMQEYAAFDAPLERLVTDSKRRADAFPPKGEKSGGAQFNARQDDLCADLTYDILVNHALCVPTLHEEGKYVRCTALVVEAATCRECKMAGRACARHFERLREREGLRPLRGLSAAERRMEMESDPWPYSRRGRRPREQSSGESDEVADLIAADAREHRRKRMEEVRSYPPLEQLLDKMLR